MNILYYYSFHVSFHFSFFMIIYFLICFFYLKQSGKTARKMAETAGLKDIVAAIDAYTSAQELEL